MELKTVKPLGKNILVSVTPDDLTTESGIILVNPIGKKSAKGQILSIGNKVKADLKVGDNVIYSQYADDEFEFEDKKCALILEGDIFGVIE